MPGSTGRNGDGQPKKKLLFAGAFLARWLGNPGRAPSITETDKRGTADCCRSQRPSLLDATVEEICEPKRWTRVLSPISAAVLGMPETCSTSACGPNAATTKQLVLPRADRSPDIGRSVPAGMCFLVPSPRRSDDMAQIRSACLKP